MRSPTGLAILAALSTVSSAALAAQTDAPAPPKSGAVKVQTVVEGLRNPWALAFLPDGRMLVTERLGSMRVAGKDGKLSDKFKNVPDVMEFGQGGLLDVILANDYATSGTIFFSFSQWREGSSKSGTTVARAKLVIEGNGGRLDGIKIIFQQQPAIESSAHFGSRLVQTKDGSIFVTTGDRQSQRKEAQNPANHIGKILRINPDGSPAGDNPKLPGWKPEIWSIGHRNVQGATLHPETGRLWTVEHGAQGGDELNSPEKGKNYGWPVISYGVNYGGAKIGEGTAKSGLEQPVYYWDPSIAPSGLAFYSGDLVPEWKGNAFVGALAGTHLQRLILEGDKVVASEELLANLNERIRDVRQGPDGALWVLTDGPDGKILRLTK